MDKLELTIGRLERDRKEGGETLIQIALQYPVISGEGEVLNACLARTAENLVTALAQEMQGEARAAAKQMPETLPYQINGTFTTTCNTPGVLSFYTDVFLYAGGMRGITHRYGSSFLTAGGGRTLFLTSLFPAGSDVRTLVSDFISKRHGINASALRDAFSPENFYLTDSGLEVFFPPGSVSPVAGGIAAFAMPYGESGLRSPPDMV